MESFVNTLVHTYLYTRKTYPEQIFERKFEYNCQVYTSRHDALTTYISTHLSVIFDWLKQGKLSHFVVCLQDEYTRGTIERLVFKVEPINADIYESSRISNDAENEESQTSALLRLSRIDYDIPAKTNTNMDIEGNGTGSARFIMNVLTLTYLYTYTINEYLLYAPGFPQERFNWHQCFLWQ
mmetsp:Transcript_30358/g.37515  ORF Transcript_30358/g.37515 Transcript_30358/m.37515 type:complete len:182 (+) Transcript_30358:385-930(+)